MQRGRQQQVARCAEKAAVAAVRGARAARQYGAQEKGAARRVYLQAKARQRAARGARRAYVRSKALRKPTF